MSWVPLPTEFVPPSGLGGFLFNILPVPPRRPQGSVLPHKTRHTTNGDPLPSMPFTASSSSPSVPTGIRSASLHAAVPGRLPSGAHTSSSVKSSPFCSFNANPHTLGDFSIQVGDPSVHLAPCAPLLSPNLAQPQCPCDHTLELVQGLHLLKRPTPTTTSDVSKLFPLMPQTRTPATLPVSPAHLLPPSSLDEFSLPSKLA